LDAQEVRAVEYRRGPVEEVRTGTLSCPRCGRAYPIEGYVLSFEQLYPPDLKAEGDYWGEFYGFMKERGYLGFFDLREPVAPLVTEGLDVLDPGTVGRAREKAGVQAIIADHPAFANVKRLLDVGCGTGWSSLYFARRDFEVVAFDPSAANMRLAKEYAISQGEHVEYIGAALGFLDFCPGVFDGAVALYSLHHVPNLRIEMARLRDWLRDGAVMATDEHVRTDMFLYSIAAAMHEDVRKRLYPELPSLPPEVLAALPTNEASTMEGAGSAEVIEAFLDNFAPDTFSARYIGLGTFSFLYYLTKGMDEPSYHYAGQVIESLSHYLNEAHPEQAEAALMVGYKLPPAQGPGSRAGAARALPVAEPDSDDPVTALTAAYDAEIERLRGAIDAKDRNITELEKWARGMERSLQARDAAARAATRTPLNRARTRISRLLGRSK
jgi:SAM-dependent methyltransferase